MGKGNGKWWVGSWVDKVDKVGRRVMYLCMYIYSICAVSIHGKQYNPI